MKITKRQLRKIIKEEKQKILNENTSQRTLDDLYYQFEKEINARLGSEDRKWYQNPETMESVMAMLDRLKGQMEEYSRM